MTSIAPSLYFPDQIDNVSANSETLKLEKIIYSLHRSTSLICENKFRLIHKFYNCDSRIVGKLWAVLKN
jgi:hypothetical protein